MNLSQTIFQFRLADVTGAAEETAGAAEKALAPGGLPGWVIPAIIAAAVLIIAIVVLARRKPAGKSTGKPSGKPAGKAAARQKPAPKPDSAVTTPTAPGPAPEIERETLPITAVGNVHGIGSRQDQQDAFGVSSIANNKLVKQKGILAIVADGMGGLENSGEISQTIVRSALKRFSEFSGNQRETLLMLGANINSIASDNFTGSTGTTFIAASIFENQLDFISIGDSRIALCRAGSLLTLNRVHNYAADLDSSAARGLMSVSSAMNDPKRARLTSYVGMNEPKAVDMPVSPIHLSRGDKIIVMTDGVFGTLSDEKIVEALALSAPEAALRLDELIKAEARENQDNYTAIIIEI